MQHAVVYKTSCAFRLHFLLLINQNFFPIIKDAFLSFDHVFKAYYAVIYF